MRLFKILLSLIVGLFLSCNLNTNNINPGIDVILKISNGTRAELAIDSMTLTVEASDMNTIEATSVNSSINVDVEFGADRTFTIDVTLTDGSTLSGSTTQDVTADTTSIFIDVTYNEVVVTEVTIITSVTTFSIGSSYTIEAEVTPNDATDQSVTWSSSNLKIATVDPDSGIVTPISTGEVTITATSADGTTTDELIVTVVESDTPTDTSKSDYTYYEFEMTETFDSETIVMDIGVTTYNGELAIHYSETDDNMEYNGEVLRVSSYTQSELDDVVTFIIPAEDPELSDEPFNYYIDFTFTEDSTGTYAKYDDIDGITSDKTTGTFAAYTQSSCSKILDFNIDDSEFEISGTDVTIYYEGEGDIASLTPTITIPLGSTISPNTNVTQDFTNDVEYTVTAQDGTQTIYTVTVTNTEIYISFSSPTDYDIDFGDFDGEIDSSGYYDETVYVTTTETVTSWQWYLDGELIDGATSDSYTLNGSNYNIGTHLLSVAAVINEETYAASFSFDCINSEEEAY